MTECTSTELRAKAPGRREYVARFDGGDISSDGGTILLGETERKTAILARFAACWRDHRAPERVHHSVREMVTQRVLGLCSAYEDLNDHDELRHDPLLCSLAGKREPKQQPLASSSTLNRLELGAEAIDGDERYKRVALDFEAVDRLLVQIFLESYTKPPVEIVLDLDVTDDPLHGKQEGRFFHGYYDCYCYMPLYIFCGEHLLCARLRRSNQDGSAGALDEVKRIVTQIRESWADVRIIVRGDSGFCREELMAWCESEPKVDYVLGMARNPRLEHRIAPDLLAAKDICEAMDAPHRIFTSFRYITRESWSRKRRVVAKAEHLPKGANPRFVVTSLPKKRFADRQLYEELYCARGDMENRIKEQQLYLFADRTSTHWMRSNQVRLYFSSIAYVLLQALRELGLQGTRLAKAQCHTIRLKLLKIGALIRVTTRKVWISLAGSCPYAGLFVEVWHRLRSMRPRFA